MRASSSWCPVLLLLGAAQVEDRVEEASAFISVLEDLQPNYAGGYNAFAEVRAASHLSLTQRHAPAPNHHGALRVTCARAHLAAAQVWERLCRVPPSARVRVGNELDPGSLRGLWRASMQRYVLPDARAAQLLGGFSVLADFPQQPGEVRGAPLVRPLARWAGTCTHHGSSKLPCHRRQGREAPFAPAAHIICLPEMAPPDVMLNTQTRGPPVQVVTYEGWAERWERVAPDQKFRVDARLQSRCGGDGGGGLRGRKALFQLLVKSTLPACLQLQISPILT